MLHFSPPVISGFLRIQPQGSQIADRIIIHKTTIFELFYFFFFCSPSAPESLFPFILLTFLSFYDRETCYFTGCFSIICTRLKRCQASFAPTSKKLREKVYNMIRFYLCCCFPYSVSYSDNSGIFHWMADRKVQPQCKRLQLSSNRTVGIQSNLKSNRCTHDRNRIRKYSGRARAVYRKSPQFLWYSSDVLPLSETDRICGEKEMEKIPLLSTWMRFVYCLFLDRENPKEGLKTILQAIDYVKQGISICISLRERETKAKELSMLPFKEGAFKIAAKNRMCESSDFHEQQLPRSLKISFQGSKRSMLS